MSHQIFKKISTALIGLSLLASTSPVFALTVPNRATNQDASSAGNPKYMLQQRIDNIKNNAENRIETIKDKVASREAILKAKLQKFKDQRKASLAEKINTSLNRVNQNQTTQMQKHLATMNTILGKLENRINAQTSDIKDPAAAKTAIASARSAIASASALVTAQSQKDYTILITSESKVKADAKLQRDKLHTDLQTLRKAVMDAKQAVANAIRVAKLGATPENLAPRKEGSTSGQR